MISEAKTLKDYAKEAKKRLKSGYWQKHNDNLNKKLEEAEKDGVSASNVTLYYTKKAEREIKRSDDEFENFYLKVKEILDREGFVSDIIGRLTEREVYEKLSYEQRQRYTFELSSKYLKAKERYIEEKQFE